MNRFKRSIGLLVIMLAITALSAFAFITGVNVQKIGPMYAAGNTFDSTTIGGVGGHLKTYLVATNDTERIGNVVFLSSKNTVNHSATLANYNTVAGVVVGGAATGMQASISVSDTSTIAATSGQAVLVMERGRFWVLVDTGPGIAPGIQVVASARSNQGGRINGRTTAIDTFSRIFATLVDTGLAGKAALAEIKVK